MANANASHSVSGVYLVIIFELHAAYTSQAAGKQCLHTIFSVHPFALKRLHARPLDI